EEARGAAVEVRVPAKDGRRHEEALEGGRAVAQVLARHRAAKPLALEVVARDLEQGVPHRAEAPARVQRNDASDAARDPGAAGERGDAEARAPRDEARERVPGAHLDAPLLHALEAQPRGREHGSLEAPVRHEQVAPAAQDAERDAAGAARADDLAGLVLGLRLEEELGDAPDAKRRAP